MNWNQIRDLVEQVRTWEKSIMDICVKQCRMPRKDFLAVFVDAETNPNWVKNLVKAKKPHAAAIKERMAQRAAAITPAQAAE